VFPSHLAHAQRLSRECDLGDTACSETTTRSQPEEEDSAHSGSLFDKEIVKVPTIYDVAQRAG
jgi:hypothetical protein